MMELFVGAGIVLALIIIDVVTDKTITIGYIYK